MKQLLKISSLISLIFVFNTLYAQNDLKVFRYKLKGYPKTDSCYLIAKELGKKFYEQTNISEYTANCVSEDQYGFDIIIEYKAEKPLNIVSTENGSFVWPAGSYQTKEECEANYDKEIEIFVQQTRLNPFVSFCYKNDFVSKQSWEFRIDAFGESAINSFRSGLLLWGIPVNVSSYEEFTHELQDILMNLDDVTVSYVVVRPKLVYLELTLRYYATKPLDLKLMSFASFNHKGECEIEFNALSTIFNNLGFNTLKTYCSNVLAIQATELNALYNQIENFRVIQLLEKYKTFSECLKNKENVLQYQKEVLGKPVVGGICSKNLEDNLYVIKSFERKQ